MDGLQAVEKTQKQVRQTVRTMLRGWNGLKPPGATRRRTSSSESEDGGAK